MLDPSPAAPPSATVPEGLTHQQGERMRARLDRLYPGRATEILAALTRRIVNRRKQIPPTGHGHWDETDVLLITYADQVRSDESHPLDTLARFFEEESLEGLISTVHLLPFFPYSSDDGFSVIDYRVVDPKVGDWGDIARIAKRFRLMFDLVLNHISSQSEWFRAYLRGEPDFQRWFIEADPTLDYSQVVRPRSLPLLTEVQSAAGPRHVWTTFSADQIDLNFAEPAVLLEMVDVLLEYAARGAQIVRLDAVGYLWKELGTSCIHLPQTHEVVKMLRDVLEASAPHVWVLTETNVPHSENISYFGGGEEAHIVYQFSLPPLLLDAFVFGNAELLMSWLAELSPTPPGATFLNFTASHDGIGLRPLEGIATDEHLDRLVEAVRARGGLVSTRTRSDGTESPYELNISYVDAMAPGDGTDTALHAARFLASQAVMLALQGIPAVYFHSLIGSRGDLEGAREFPRRINRRKLTESELRQQIGEPDSLSQRIYSGYRHLLKVRRAVRAFNPEQPQRVLTGLDRRVIAFARGECGSPEEIVVLANASEQVVLLDLTPLAMGASVDLISGTKIGDAGALELHPGQAVWLARTE
jgi:glycosidase